MAKFRRIKIDPADTAENVWATIRTHMMVSQSVELVAITGQGSKVQIEVRPWTETRQDDSNADDADAQKTY